MKVFMFGALLVQTLVAQVTDDASATSDGLAPLLTPASDAPAEIELLGTPTDASIESLVDLPTGTADVVLDPSPTESADDPTITDEIFGGEESAVDGVVFDGSEFNFPTPVLAPEITPTPISAVDEPVEINIVESENASSDDLGLGDATATEDFGLGSFAAASADANLAAEASVEPSVSLDFVDPSLIIDPFATATEDLFGDATPVSDSEALDNGIAIAPEQADLLAAAGDVGAADAEYDSLGAWTGEDDSVYDGQDVGDEFDDSECPAYCLEEGYDKNDSVEPYEAEAREDAKEDDSEDDLPLVRRIINWLRPRQAPSSNRGFAAFSWPDAQPKEDTAGCTKDVPDWLYESSGKKQEHCKAVRPKCPASCYRTTPSKSTGRYKTRPWTKPHWSPKPHPASPVPDKYEKYTPVLTPDASPTDGYDTQTTFVTSTTTVPNPYYDDSSKDYTGETLDTVCPKQCNPFDPAANKCDITSSCTTTGNGKYYCACPAGLRAGAWNEKDFSKQFKFASQPYVYAAEGVVCDKLCSDQTCSEVMMRPQCQ